MKLKMKSSRLLSLIISLFGLAAVWSQTLEQTEQVADKFMEQGDYYSAAKFYSRVYFFADKSQLGRINGKLGMAYFGKGDFKRAYNHFDVAQKLESDDSTKTEWFLRKTSALILRHQYKLALLGILNYRGKFTSRQQKNLIFLKGTVYFAEEKYDEAKKTFVQIIDPGDSLALARLDSLFTKKNLMRPNPVTAKWLSIFIPGLGQIYAGDIKNGINSFALNATLFYLFARDAVRFSFTESFFVFYPWIQRYYQGGYERAQRIAKKKRRQKRAQVYHGVHEILM